MSFELQKELGIVTKIERIDPFEEAHLHINDCMENNLGCKIRIIDGRHSGGLKELVVIAIEDYLVAHKGENWETGNIIRDINSENLAAYLNKTFPDEAPWVVNASQSPFDIYSLKAKVTIELKSAKGKQKNTVGNATLYPTEACIRDIIPKYKWNVNWSERYLDTLLDVIVVFVSKKGNSLDDYFITDGSYWGIELEDYLSCRELFNVVNQPEMIKKIFDLIVKDNPDQIFAKRMLTDAYNGNVDFLWRKLISYKNPLGD